MLSNDGDLHGEKNEYLTLLLDSVVTYILSQYMKNNCSKYGLLNL